MGHRYGGVVALLLLSLAAALADEPAKPPAYSIRRVVSKRPASAGAFDPGGQRFTFVYGDRLWLSERGQVRRIGFPAVDNVYRASWLSATQVLVSYVMPGEGDALGVLDLAAGRFRPLVRHVHEEDFTVSRGGGLIVWRPAPGGAPPGDAWMATAGGPHVRLAGGECAGLAVPAPGGQSVAGVDHAGKPCLHLAPSGGAVALAAETGDVAGAAAWAPDGGAVAYLVASAPAAAGLSPQAAPSVVTAPAGAATHALVVYRVGETAPALRQALPQACDDLAWDAEGLGVFCRSVGDDPGVWYVPCARPGEPRRVYTGRVGQWVPLAGGCALALVAAPEKPWLSRLALLSASGAAPVRITNTPSFDHLDDVSADSRKVLITRRGRDDRQSLYPESTLWCFELR